MNVLIADDDPISLKLLETYLSRWGYAVTAARDGAEAWSLFQEGEFEIVITDWTMPNVDGLELIRRIRELPRGRYVYALLLTARAEAGDIVQGMETGADDFIGKPFDRDELRVRVREGERVVGLEVALSEARRNTDALTANAHRLSAAVTAVRERLAAMSAGTVSAGDLAAMIAELDAILGGE